MKILAIIQSRSSSARLPKKSLLPIAGIPNTLLIAKRCSSKKYKTIVATSNKKSDDLLVKLLKKAKINYFRGSLNNVRNRFLECSRHFNDEDILIRLTADNVFVDNKIIEKVLKEYKNKKTNYIYIDNKFSNLPYGISVEAFNLGFFRNKKIESKSELEHVTINFPKKYQNKFSYKNKNNLSKLRCTLDTREDYSNILKVFARIKKPVDIKWSRICSILEQLNLPKKKNSKTKKYITT
jgi:spore coat polysaccharide biosynthesis protein SpsF (cytidylyltransferase family)